MKLPKHEHVEIMPWHKGYNEKPIDLKNNVEVCNWCREMHKYKAEPNDTSVIDRWNIGIYQLTYLPKLMTVIEPVEFGEAVGSVFIHMVGAFEYCGVETIDMLDRLRGDNESYGSVHDNYRMILTLIPSITKQIYYYGKSRKNRFEIEKLENGVEKVLIALLAMTNRYPRGLLLEDSLMLAMAKVQEKEFKTHG